MLTTGLGMQYLCVILLIGTPICSLGKKVLHDPCKINSDCGENQICVHKKCSCESESFVWHGKYCLKAKKFGDICKDQSECSKSGDTFLHCLSTKDGSKRCLCSNGYDLVGDKCTKKEFHVNKMKPLPTPHISKTLSYPPLNIYAAPEAQHHEDIQLIDFFLFHIEFIRWFHEFPVATNLRIFQETNSVYLSLCTFNVENNIHFQ